MKEDIKTKIESHLKIVDVTDKSSPKTIISKRLFNVKKTLNTKADKNSKPKK
jgi:hypothetical protein